MKEYELPENAIGFKDDFSPEELSGKHVDGVTGAVFETEEEYLNHVNAETGFTPKDIEHQDALTGGQFSVQAEAALKRGADAKKKK